VRVVDGAIADEWRVKLIVANEATSFIPQGILKLTVGSPQTLAINTLIKGFRTAPSSNPNASQRPFLVVSSDDLGRSADDDRETEPDGYAERQNTSPELVEALWERVSEHIVPTLMGRGGQFDDQGV